MELMYSFYPTVATVLKFHQVGMWVTFEVGGNFHHLPAHEISLSTREEMPKVLPFFHAFTMWFLLFWTWKEDGMGNLEIFQKYNYCFPFVE